MLGFSLSLPSLLRSGELGTVPSEIRAILSPVTYELHEGQSGSDIPDIGQYLQASNYFSPDGTIAPPRFLVNGAVADISDLLGAGDAVTILVEDDSDAPDRIWLIDADVAVYDFPPPAAWSYEPAITTLTVTDWPLYLSPVFSYPSVTSTTLEVTF